MEGTPAESGPCEGRGPQCDGCTRAHIWQHQLGRKASGFLGRHGVPAPTRLQGRVAREDGYEERYRRVGGNRPSSRGRTDVETPMIGGLRSVNPSCGLAVPVGEYDLALPGRIHLRRVRSGATSGDSYRLVWFFVRFFEHIVSFCYKWPVGAVRTARALIGAISCPVNDFRGFERTVASSLLSMRADTLPSGPEWASPDQRNHPRKG